MAFRSQLANPFVSGMQLHARALTGDHKLRIIWKKLPPHMGAGYDFKTNTILMPKVNTTLLAQADMNKLKALSYHERLHHALSSREVFESDGFQKADSVVQNLFQVIEDCRIEMNKHYRLPGDLEDLEFYRTRLFVPDIVKEFPMGQYMNPWGSLMMLIKMNLPGYANEQPVDELRSYYDAAWAILNDGRFHKSCEQKHEGSAMTLKLAKEIRDAWQQEAENDPNMSEGPSMPGVPQLTIDKGEQGQSDDENSESDSDGEGQEGQGKGKGKGKGKGSKSEEDGEGQEGENSEGSSDGENNGGSDGDESSEGSSQGDQDEDENEGRPESGKEGHGTEEDCDTADIERQFQQAQKNKNAWTFDNDQLNKEVGDLGREGRKPTKEEEQIIKGAEEIKNEESDSEFAPRRRGLSYKKFNADCEDYVPYNVYDRTIVANDFPEQADAIRDQISGKIATTRKDLMRILLGLSQDRTLSCLKRGKLDFRMLHKVPKHDHRVFSKKIKAKRVKCAVQMVIDLSGSMTYGHGLSRAEVAAQACMLLGECLAVLNVPFEIIGFNTSPAQRGFWGENPPAGCEREAAEAEKNGMDRCQDIINRWVFKTFDETYSKAYPRLGAMSVSMNTNNLDTTGCVGGCNIDHEVILWGASRLWQQLPERKIQIVLSDGQPSGYGHDYGGLLDRMLCLTNSKIMRSGIEQYCFSIQSDCCQHYYRHWKIINKIEDLNSEALKFLASAANLKGTARY